MIAHDDDKFHPHLITERGDILLDRRRAAYETDLDRVDATYCALRQHAVFTRAVADRDHEINVLINKFATPGTVLRNINANFRQRLMLLG